MKKTIEVDFDKLASAYDEYKRDERFLYYIYSNLPRNRNRALDIGCGTGNLTTQLTNYFNKSYGIDISGKMIERAIHKNINNLGNIFFKKMDAEKLLYPNNYFDLVVAVNTFHHTNLLNSITQAKRVLKKNGVLIIVDVISEKKEVHVIQYTLKRIKNFILNIPIKGIRKSMQIYKHEMNFLEHLKHDNFMNKEEAFMQYKKLLPRANISEVDKKHILINWWKK